jgi:hypothetical protein
MSLSLLMLRSVSEVGHAASMHIAYLGPLWEARQLNMDVQCDVTVRVAAGYMLSGRSTWNDVVVRQKC